MFLKIINEQAISINKELLSIPFRYYKSGIRNNANAAPLLYNKVKV